MDIEVSRVVEAAGERLRRAGNFSEAAGHVTETVGVNAGGA
jgi:hypothetical protein